MAKLSDGRVRGWWWAENDLFDQGWVEKMGAHAFACYCVLLRRADSRGVAFPSLGNFTALTGVSRSEVIRSINKLEELGLVGVKRGGGAKGTNVYRILPLPEDGKPVVLKEDTVKAKASDSGEPAAPLAFARAWALFSGVPNNSKQAAVRAWNARIKEGVDPEVLVAGAERYITYCRALKTEPRFIKRTATFFGPDKHYESDYTLPEDPEGQGDGARLPKSPQSGGGKEDLLEFYGREEVVT